MMARHHHQFALQAAVALLALGIVFARLDFVIAQGPPQLAMAVLGGTAHLPCDVRAPNLTDSYILVVWYKQDVNPIFSYDIRNKHTSKASQWMSDYLNQRASFRPSPEPATLIINNVEESDEGEYRCRVDFMKNPTRNSWVHLTVIIPPNLPRIENEAGHIVKSVAGPYVEGGSMRLKCIVTGGRPQPTVRWWRRETLLDGKDGSSDSSSVKSNTLVVRNLDRSDLHAVFTCQASNNNISQPVSASVAIEMHLRPLNVTILTSEDAPLSAGRKYEINCMSVGSRPPAKLTWYMEGQLLTNYTEKISPDGNMTSSILTFVPSLLDNGKLITCRAENTHIVGAVEEDTLKLNVYYVPMLNLKLGSSMNPDDIEEGDDVYFECEVDANPGAYKVIWKHNGNALQNNAKVGLIVQQRSLALRKVSRSQSGNYTCIASNVEGDGISNSVELKIMYKPICLPTVKRVYGVARHEEARVVCQVEAYPAPESFRWTFNNTEEMSEVPEARYKNGTRQSQSVLTYKPTSEMDYGTVLCWANNRVGQQKAPCSFHIIAAGKPEPPYNCTLTNQTTQSLSVECTPGFDGGLTQHFQLEVYDQLTGQLRANVSSPESATFNVHKLESGRVLRMAVYAVNSKGRSESTLLEGFTLKVAEKQTVRVLFTGTPVPFEITPLLGILIGIVAALLLCTVTVLLALKVRSDRRAQRPGDLPLKKSTAPSSEDLYDPDDRNPDVVPTNKDSDYQLTGSTAGTPLVVQGTPDGLSTTSLPPSGQTSATSTVAAAAIAQQQQQQQQQQQPMPASMAPPANHLPSYSHNDYNNYPTLPLSGEVTYAELCLARPSPVDGKLGGLSSLAGFGGGGGVGGGVVLGGSKPSPVGLGYAKEATVYACIDHGARAPKLDSPASTASLMSDSLHLKQHPREVVTVRTPLISSQESCV